MIRDPQVAHLALPSPQANPSAMPKEPLFPYARRTFQVEVYGL